MSILYLVFKIADSIIAAFQLILVIYAVSSWFIRDPFNKFMNVLRTFIDPVLDPVRSVLERFSIVRALPIDLSFLIVYILCSFVRSLI